MPQPEKLAKAEGIHCSHLAQVTQYHCTCNNNDNSHLLSASYGYSHKPNMPSSYRREGARKQSTRHMVSAQQMGAAGPFPMWSHLVLVTTL
jgi:hypothetical protein